MVGASLSRGPWVPTTNCVIQGKQARNWRSCVISALVPPSRFLPGFTPEWTVTCTRKQTISSPSCFVAAAANYISTCHLTALNWHRYYSQKISQSPDRAQFQVCLVRFTWVSFTEWGCHKDRLDHCLDSVAILSSLAVIPRYPLGIDTGITVEAKTHRHSWNVEALCVCICILLDVTAPRLLIRYNVNIDFAVFLKMTIIINIGGLSILSTRHSFSLTFLTQLFESWV